MTVAFGPALLAAIAASAAAYAASMLTWPAATAAAAFGTVILCFGGLDWGIATAGSFFVTALIARRDDRLSPDTTRGGKTRRSLRQVVANGVLVALLACAYSMLSAAQPIVVVAALGCIAAVSGDTWASSAARLGAGSPRLVTSGKRVRAGTPGAVSGTGLLLSAVAGLVASLLFIVAAFFERPVAIETGTILVAAAIVGAVCGSLLDSYLGAAHQALYRAPDETLTDRRYGERHEPLPYVRGLRWLDNDLVNFANSLAGAASAALVWGAASVFGLV